MAKRRLHDEVDLLGERYENHPKLTRERNVNRRFIERLQAPNETGLLFCRPSLGSNRWWAVQDLNL